MTNERLTLRIPEVADQLGVSTSTVQRWVASGDLPAIRPPSGGVVLILPTDVAAFLEANREGRSQPRGSGRRN
jgi:excisionase family DNA binding protein